MEKQFEFPGSVLGMLTLIMELDFMARSSHKIILCARDTFCG